ncbi:MAG: type II secretion system protein [Planctomycetes bacterium]|nr:type II secretion system protein [Planctomycetota bacterium]
MRRFRAFTLIELLVVVAIIGLMLGIMMPSLKEVRRLSKRTVCQKNLDQIGVAIHAYLLNHKDTFPYACRLRSWELREAQKENRKPLPSLPEVLHREIGGGKNVFACPADRNTMSLPGEVPADDVIPTDRYFDNEGTSYEWESRLNGGIVGFKLARVYVTSDDRTKRYELAALYKNLMWMMFDFEAFHGGTKVRGSQNILYTDLHVDSDKWSDKKEVGKELVGVTPSPSP